MFDDVIEEYSADDSSTLVVAAPTRLAFCTRWSLSGDSLTLADDFDRIEVQSLPLAVTESTPLFLAAFWEGEPTDLKPQLRVTVPSGDSYSVRLPALKPYFSRQVQMNDLIGFIFEEFGEYRFVVCGHNRAAKTTLTVAYSPDLVASEPDDEDGNAGL